MESGSEEAVRDFCSRDERWVVNKKINKLLSGCPCRASSLFFDSSDWASGSTNECERSEI
jgi:hypothetical protein